VNNKCCKEFDLLKSDILTMNYALVAFALFSMTSSKAVAEDFKPLCDGTMELMSQGWKDIELADLHCAATSAREYAENNFGVGILIHVGKDLPNEHFSSPHDFGAIMVRLFKEKYDTETEYFLTQNDARATGLEFRIGEFIHGADDGTELKNVKEAVGSIPEVVGMLRLLWEDRQDTH
jgi:hypothetical protein